MVGAGTTAAGLLHGILNIVVSFAADQPFWGARLHAVGAGPLPISVKKLTAEKLVTALIEAEGEVIRNGTQAVGLKIQQENGGGAVVKAIEDFSVQWRKP